MVQVYKVKMENMEVRKVEKEDLNINGKILSKVQNFV